jgi:hypothetical protein
MQSLKAQPAVVHSYKYVKPTVRFLLLAHLTEDNNDRGETLIFIH